MIIYFKNYNKKDWHITSEEIIDQLRELIYNIGWNIIIDKYLDDKVAAVDDDSLDHMWR